jgi:hypothetical protein
LNCFVWLGLRITHFLLEKECKLIDDVNAAFGFLNKEGVNNSLSIFRDLYNKNPDKYFLKLISNSISKFENDIGNWDGTVTIEFK